MNLKKKSTKVVTEYELRTGDPGYSTMYDHYRRVASLTITFMDGNFYLVDSDELNRVAHLNREDWRAMELVTAEIKRLETPVKTMPADDYEAMKGVARDLRNALELISNGDENPRLTRKQMIEIAGKAWNDITGG